MAINIRICEISICTYFYSFFARRRRPPNICLTCFSVPEGLGMICTPGAAGDSANHAKGNVRLKQLLGISPKIISLNLNSLKKHMICKFYYISLIYLYTLFSISSSLHLFFPKYYSFKYSYPTTYLN